MIYNNMNFGAILTTIMLIIFETTDLPDLLKRISFTLERTCNVFFICDIVLIVISRIGNLKALIRASFIFDILSVVPFLFPSSSSSLKICKLARLGKLAKYNRSLRLAGLTLVRSVVQIAFIGTMLLTMATIFGSFVFFLEKSSNENISSIFDAIWYIIISALTVGYGDIVPSTNYGKFLGVAASLSGIIFMSLPLPGIIQNFHSGYLVYSDCMFAYAEDSKIFQTELVIAKLRQRSHLRSRELSEIACDSRIIHPEVPSSNS
ncbi:Oidioi.mRNA.OKI2018_I69.PAR.g11366.t1.cds [Oikopleura dioica]|uniref:Oidioi.mRNA.OKI2018_I69.PAR.g11366.t1.cds n=1 Tax=Oikopleura dioica TaxID=34765 RepID=A0ABN7RV88_OIKDI|nr:Oidioi.mRNA.OKI2018_I69.PAR.g11366.t1.cds [Oikopleura dioica]